MAKLPKPKKHYGLREVMHSLDKCETACCKELENLRADKRRLDFLQSLCPTKNKDNYDFNLAWTAYAAHYGGHVAVRGKKNTYYRSSIRRAIDAAMRSPQ